MMYCSRYLWAFLLGLGLSGCWSKNYDDPGRIEVPARPTEMTMNAGFQRTWAASLAVLAKFPIVKKDVDVGGGRAYLVTDWIRGKSDVLFQGYDRNRIPTIIRYKLYVYVQSVQGSTQVRIKNVEQYEDDVVKSGVDFQGSIKTWIDTPSSTLKENALLNQIQKLIRDPKFKGDEFVQ